MLQFLTRVLGFRSKATSTKRRQRTIARRQFQPKVEALETREVPTATLVKDINIGQPSSSPQELVSIGATLFFTANDGLFGRELWKRTPDGRVEMVKDIRAGGAGSDPLNLTKVGDSLYFSADDGLFGRELWISNGFREGTRMVKDINPGGVGSDPAELTELRTRVGGQPRSYLYFAATDVLFGRELWSSDPSNPNTNQATIVHDINRGPASSDPAYLTVANAKVNPTRNASIRPFMFFRANDGILGAELWRATVMRSGNRTIPNLVKDIRPGSLGSEPFNLTRVGPTTAEAAIEAGNFKRQALFFGADDGVVGAELWRSFGNFVDTTLIKDINPGTAPSMEASRTRLMANFRGLLFFAADNGFQGRELWVSNSNFGGARLLADINPGPGSSNPTAQEHPLPQRRNLILKQRHPRNTSFYIDGMLFFGADDSFTGGELWATNGVRTFRVADINPGLASGLDQNELVGIAVNARNPAQSRIYFAANDNVFGRELWIGTPFLSQGKIVNAAVRLDSDINPGPVPSDPSAFEIVTRGGVQSVFFAADKALFGRELWQVDRTFPRRMPPKLNPD